MTELDRIKRYVFDIVTNGEIQSMKIFEDAIPRCDVVALSNYVSDVHSGRIIAGLLNNVYPRDRRIKDMFIKSRDNAEIADEGIREFANRCKCIHIDK